MDGINIEFAVVLLWFVALLFEIKDAIVDHFLSHGFPVGFGPSGLSGVVLGFEVAVAFGATKAEQLCPLY